MPIARENGLQRALKEQWPALRLSVSDDGVGLAQELAAGRPGHLGIVGMRERANAIGARLQAEGRAGGGTVISLTWSAKETRAVA